jgi:hypothetical protein
VKSGRGTAARFLRLLFLIALIEVPLLLIFFYEVEPALQARSFTPETLNDLGGRTPPIVRNNPVVRRGKPLFRTGRMAVVMAQHEIMREKKRGLSAPALHASWFGLGRSLRASSPHSAQTLVRVHLPSCRARGPSAKTVSVHLYDRLQKRYLGSHLFTPEKVEVPASKDGKTRASVRYEMAGPKEIAAFLASLPVQSIPNPKVRKSKVRRRKPKAFWLEWLAEPTPENPRLKLKAKAKPKRSTKKK